MSCVRLVAILYTNLQTLNTGVIYTQSSTVLSGAQVL